MRLVDVARAGLGQDVLLGGVFAAEVCEGAGRLVGAIEVIDEALDAILRSVGIVEGGVRHVDSAIDDAQQHALARKGFRQRKALVHRRALDPLRRDIEEMLPAGMRLDAHHTLVGSQLRQLPEGDVGDIDGSDARQRLAAILREQAFVHALLQLYKHADLAVCRGPVGHALRTGQQVPDFIRQFVALGGLHRQIACQQCRQHNNT